MCPSLTWVRDHTRIHYEKKANQQKQRDALDNVLVAWMYILFVTSSLPKYCCRPGTLLKDNSAP